MYSYEKEKASLFTEENQRLFLDIRDRVLLSKEDFTLANAIKGFYGSSYTMIACIDRLVELNEIYEKGNSRVFNNRVFSRH